MKLVIELVLYIFVCCLAWYPRLSLASSNKLHTGVVHKLHLQNLTILTMYLCLLTHALPYLLTKIDTFLTMYVNHVYHNNVL